MTGGEDNAMKKGVRAGKYQLVFVTPELLLDNMRWKSMLAGPTYSNRLRGFVVDEAHCISKWYFLINYLNYSVYVTTIIIGEILFAQLYFE